MVTTFTAPSSVCCKTCRCSGIQHSREVSQQPQRCPRELFPVVPDPAPQEAWTVEWLWSCKPPEGPLTCTLFLLLSPSVFMGISYLDLWNLVYWAVIGPLQPSFTDSRGWSICPPTFQTLRHYFLSIYLLSLTQNFGLLSSCFNFGSLHHLVSDLD